MHIYVPVLIHTNIRRHTNMHAMNKYLQARIKSHMPTHGHARTNKYNFATLVNTNENAMAHAITTANIQIQMQKHV